MLEAKNAKLLIIDDSIVARMAIVKMLGNKVSSITEASNGSAAVEMLKKESFDCILMDYLMPGLNGLTTLKIIREMGINTPIIIISANQQESVLSKFKEYNVTAILKKHVNSDELFEALCKALSN